MKLPRTRLTFALTLTLALPCMAAGAAPTQATGSTLPAHTMSVGPATVQAGKATGWRADIGRYAQRMIDAGFVPGMSIAVTRGDRVVYADGFGVADTRSGRRVDADSRFYIASTTKALTATAVVLQASRGTLQLDAPVTRYLPTLQFKAPLQAASISIRDLLSMTDGIDECLPVVFRTAYSGVYTQARLIGLMRHCGPARSGHAFAYRNVPYNILGMVLAPTMANGWKSVVRTDVLQPLGMHQTSARRSTLDPAQIAMPHEATGAGFRRIRLAKQDANLHAAGGYFTTARDLARFIAVHAADGVLDGKRIFPRGVLASTHARHADQDREFGPYHRFGWGYGWDLGTYAGHTLVHRFGRFAGYRSHASFMPDSGIGVVVLVNGTAVPFAADEMADYIYDRLGHNPTRMQAHTAAFRQLQERKARFAQRIAAHEALQRKRQRTPLAHPLTAYTGRYVNALLGTMVWRVAEHHLQASIGVARSDAEAFDAAKDQLRVELTGSGEVVTFQFAHGADAAGSLEYNGYRFKRH